MNSVSTGNWDNSKKFLHFPTCVAFDWSNSCPWELCLASLSASFRKSIFWLFKIMCAFRATRTGPALCSAAIAMSAELSELGCAQHGDGHLIHPQRVPTLVKSASLFCSTHDAPGTKRRQCEGWVQGGRICWSQWELPEAEIQGADARYEMGWNNHSVRGMDRMSDHEHAS